MNEWWEGLTGVTQFFYGMATFFSVFFVWQVIAAFLGMTGDDADLDGGDAGDIDMDVDADVSDSIDHHDVIESAQAFKIVSLRSVITFFTVFSWGCALYAGGGMAPGKAIGISTVWGVVGMFSIAFVFYGMAKLAETGTKNVNSCKGTLATVYLDIPADGYGEIKTMINGAFEHVRARNMDDEVLPAGTQVKVVEVFNQTLVGVRKLTSKGEE